MKKTKTKKVWLELQKQKGKKYITGVYFGDMPPQNMMFTYKVAGKKIKTAWLFDKWYIPATITYNLDTR